MTLVYRPEDTLISGPAHAMIVVGGTGELPDIDHLAKSIEESLGYPVTIELRILPQDIEYYPRVLRLPATGL